MYKRKFTLIAVITLSLLQIPMQTVFGFACSGDSPHSVQNQRDQVIDHGDEMKMSDCHSDTFCVSDSCCQQCFSAQLFLSTPHPAILSAVLDIRIATPDRKHQAFYEYLFRPPRSTILS